MINGHKVLGVFAHPDDETFLAGPLLAKCAAMGAEVRLVCATVREPASEGEPRTSSWAWLSAAAGELGISHLDGLGYGGSWMGHEPDDPDSLATVPLMEVTSRISAIIGEFRPNIVITDAAYGAYGHPDHILVHRATAAAVQEAAAGSEDQGPSLYALAYPLLLVRLWVRLLPLFGVNTRRLAGRDDLDLRALAAARYPVSLKVNVRRYVGHRKRASRHYGPIIRAAPFPLRTLEALPVPLQQPLLGRTWLTRINPLHGVGETEADAFLSGRTADRRGVTR